MKKSKLGIWSLCLLMQIAGVSKAVAEEYDYSELRENIVYGGKLATANDPFSYSTVKILSFGRFFCSGTLVAPDIVISAAHCSPGFKARGATVEIANQSLVVADYRVHPSAVIKKSFLGLSESTYFDIMVIYLERPALAPAQPVALPRRGDKLSKKESLVLAGYGCRNRVGPLDRGRLSYDMVSSARYVTASKGASIQINTTGAACQGDSGGPVYGVRNKKLVLFGITSWGDKLGFLTRAEPVEPYLDWIEQMVLDLRAGAAI